MKIGDNEKAKLIFKDMLLIHRKHPSNSSITYSYFEILLSRGCADKVIRKTNRFFRLSSINEGDPNHFNKAGTKLTLGRALKQKMNFSNAVYWLTQSLVEFRELRVQDIVLDCLLERASIYRETYDFSHARQDLQEIFDIAEPSGMRLHLTDYHLEMARLLLAEKETPPNLPLSGEEQDASAMAVQERPSPDKGRPGGVSSAQAELSFADHVNAVAKLIEETGYHRRDKELLELQQILAKDNSP